MSSLASTMIASYYASANVYTIRILCMCGILRYMYVRGTYTLFRYYVRAYLYSIEAVKSLSLDMVGPLGKHNP